MSLSKRVVAESPDWLVAAQSVLDQADPKRDDISRALSSATGDQQLAMAFLIANMNGSDLGEIGMDLLAENVKLADEVWAQVPWEKAIPQDIWLNDVVPDAQMA